MIVGVDIGASMTKAVAMEKLKIVGLAMTPTVDIIVSLSNVLERVLSASGRSLKDISEMAISGGGARLIGDTFSEIHVTKVDEIRAIGLGGLILSGKKRALIVSMGTGTALVAAYDGGRRISHICGTGVGGGTILGLSKRLLGKSDFETLEKMATRGNTNMVDLTVADIVGGSIGIIPAEATASNFGRLSDKPDENDIAAGIFNLVSQVIGVLTVMAAKAYNLEENVVLVGRVAGSRKVSEIIRNTTGIFGINICIPEKCEYCVAVGAAGSVYLSKRF